MRIILRSVGNLIVATFLTVQSLRPGRMVPVGGENRVPDLIWLGLVFAFWVTGLIMLCYSIFIYHRSRRTS